MTDPMQEAKWTADRIRWLLHHEPTLFSTAKELLSRAPEIMKQLDNLVNELELRRGQIARLKDVLKPFADYADPRGVFPTSMTITTGSDYAKTQLKMGQCYLAKTVLNDLETEK